MKFVYTVALAFLVVLIAQSAYGIIIIIFKLIYYYFLIEFFFSWATEIL